MYPYSNRIKGERAENIELAIAVSRGLVEIDQAERDRLRQEQLRRQQEFEENKRKEQEKLEKERDLPLAAALRYRNFQTTVFAVGAGLSVGAIVISASSQVTDKNPIQIPLSPTASVSPHPFILWVFGSIISALVAASITWYVTKSWQKQSDEKKQQNNVSGKDGSAI